MDPNPNPAAPQQPVLQTVPTTPPPSTPPSSLQLDSVYPTITITIPQNPNRFFAIPLVGFLIKNIILLPVFIFIFILYWVNGILTILNAFVVLFSGKYWKTAYDFNVRMLNYTLKFSAYFYGLTDKYPGFSLMGNENCNVTIGYPEHPSRFFAIPILGIFVRGIMLVPFLIFVSILVYAMAVAFVTYSWFCVLFLGRYPESAYELGVDVLRLQFSGWCYFSGLSDKYPSFKINMNHKIVKIILIVIGILYMIFSVSSGFNRAYQNASQKASVQYNSTHGPHDLNITPSASPF